jgi:PAS domain S-box-containing protein
MTVRGSVVQLSLRAQAPAGVFNSPRLAGRGVQVLALAAVYAIVGRFGLAIAPVHSFASLVWPPTGIALATLLLGGARLWPGVALGAFLVNAWTGAPVFVAAGMSVGNTLEALLGAHLICRFGVRAGSLERVRNVVAFIVLGALLSTTLSATVGVSSLLAGGLVTSADLADTWRVWWLGDAVGALVVGSSILAWRGSARRPLDARRRTEAALLVGSLITATLLVFLRPAAAAAGGIVQACMLIPLLMWGALRFELRGATAAVFLASAIAVAATALGRGPFAQESSSGGLLYLQAFMAIVATAVLVVGAVTAERADALRRCELADEALRGSEDELRRITNTTPLMLTRCSSDLRYLFVNRAYAQMLGRSPDEISGKPIVQIMGAQGYETIRPYVEAVLRGRKVEYEDDVHFEGVGDRTLHVTYAPDANERGDVIGWVASIIDITDRKRAEAEARSLAQFPEENPNPVMRASMDGSVLYANRAARELLHGSGTQDGRLPQVLLEALPRVPQRSTIRDLELSSAPDRVHVFTLSRSAGEGHVNLFGLDITDRKRAEDALREANRRKSEFLGVLSHELRNPLAPIRNALHLLHRGPEDAVRASRATAVIERQTNQLARLVDDLLDVTRISRGKIQLRRHRVELTELVRYTVEDHRPAFDARGVALGVRIVPGPIWIDADAARLTQVVGNLLQNAAKFTRPHGHVAVRVERDGAAHASIRVSDDGIGIHSEVLPSIFEPFTQADDSLDRSLGGLGLGLSLSKAIVEMHGGRVEAKSPGLGRGTELTVSLPVLTDVGGEREPAPARRRPPAVRRRVLVIDDNVDAAEMLRETLAMSDHEVAVAHDGEDGLAKARAFKPDIVICDIGLPTLDGYEVARRIRADRTLSPELIAVTGYALPEDQAKAFEAGFHHHLAKPFDLTALEALLAEVSAKPAAHRVLIVDDHDDVRSNIREMLEAEGWNVEEARSGIQTFELLARFAPDVILLDDRIPDMDRDEVLRRLRANDPAPRVVLMTASADVRQLTLGHGLRVYVPRPFGDEDLIEILEQTIAPS